MVHLADGSFVTPERVVVLTVFGIRVADCGEHLVPGGGVGVRLWHTVWWLPTTQKKKKKREMVNIVITFIKLFVLN